MKLLDVTLSGFKSFAHKTTFQFGEGLTAVIGPNGSGKSNLTEGIKWVLGEQSLKSLRGKKSDDVIFAGSAQHPRAGAATVTLTLSNESGRLGVDAAEVALTRRIDRSGESEYRLNGEPVRLLDVQQLLADAGIGTKSYTVISQGTVDRYLSAAPAGRRELFDEATGIKSLQLKVGRAQRKLAQAQGDSHELRTIIAELEPRLRVLRRQIDRHHEREQVVQEYADKHAVWLQHRWHKQAAVLQQAAQHQREARATAALARATRENIERELFAALQEAAPTATTHERIAQRLAEATTTFQAAQEAYDSAANARQELEESLKLVRTQRARAERQLANARRSLAPMDLFGRLRALLERCHQLLTAWRDNHAPEVIAALQHDIARALEESTREENTMQAAQQLLEQLTGPLQAVARLQALEQEREERWKNLPQLYPPDDHDVRHLQGLLAHGATSHDHTPSPLHEHLALSRTQEITAERADSTAQAEWQQAHSALEHIEAEISREKGTAFLEATRQASPPHAGHVSSQQELHLLSARLQSLGDIDPLAAKEYEEVAARYDHLREQAADIAATITTTTALTSRLQRQMRQRFREQFAVIQQSFAAYFVKLFDGGSAKLEIVEVPVASDAAGDSTPETDTVAGIEITVHPPGKKPQHIGLLSGGEKALTSLALLFAILDVQQPPFLVLDEVDAALDEANSWRFAQMLQEKSATTQCIVISHNRETMGQADVLYGVTMQDDGVSKVYSVKMADITEAEEIQV